MESITIGARKRTVLCPASVALATAVSADFATGRAIAVFYAQTGSASWVGIFIAALIFGLLSGLICALARKSGARTFPELLRRMPGGRMGKGFGRIYLLAAALTAWMCIASAAHTGALSLPIRHAALWSGAAAALASAAIASAKPEKQRRIGAAFVGLMALFEAAVLFFGGGAEGLHPFEVELRLNGSIPAAALLGAMHASACACIAAGSIVSEAKGCAWPLRLGIVAGCMFGLLLAGGNAALMARPAQARALHLPFVALASAWGYAGFAIAAGMRAFAAITTLAGLIPVLLPLNWSKRC